MNVRVSPPFCRERRFNAESSPSPHSIMASSSRTTYSRCTLTEGTCQASSCRPLFPDTAASRLLQPEPAAPSPQPGARGSRSCSCMIALQKQSNCSSSAVRNEMLNVYHAIRMSKRHPDQPWRQKNSSRKANNPCSAAATALVSDLPLVKRGRQAHDHVLDLCDVQNQLNMPLVRTS